MAINSIPKSMIAEDKRRIKKCKTIDDVKRRLASKEQTEEKVEYTDIRSKKNYLG